MCPVASEGAGGVALIRLANAGELALLAANIWLVAGEYAISSTRNALLPVGTVPWATGAAGLFTLKDRSVLPPSPAYSVAIPPLLTTTTPSGPETAVPPGAGGPPAGTSPTKPPAWPMSLFVAPLMMSTLLFERSAK